ncbi:hypothetical protein [Neobacillus drentensis]|uniref:hypothetical protein n=1 Tax=Neobacillus drentensis TaxID=220684 RepID=UPI002FFDCFF7
MENNFNVVEAFNKFKKETDRVFYNRIAKSYFNVPVHYNFPTLRDISFEVFKSYFDKEIKEFYKKYKLNKQKKIILLGEIETNEENDLDSPFETLNSTLNNIYLNYQGVFEERTRYCLKNEKQFRKDNYQLAYIDERDGSGTFPFRKTW